MWRFSLLFGVSIADLLHRRSSRSRSRPGSRSAGIASVVADVRRDLGAVRAQRHRRVPRAHPVPRTGEPPVRGRSRSAPASAACCSSRCSAGSTARASSSSSARSRASGALLFAVDAGEPRAASVLPVVAVVLVAGFSVGERATATRAATRSCASSGRRRPPDPQHDYERWNAFSRVTVDGDPTRLGRPPGYGSAHAPRQHPPSMPMLIDGTAGTITVRRRRGETDFLRVRHQQPRPLHPPDRPTSPSSASAAAATCSRRSSSDQTSVTGIEINGDILDIVNGTLRRLHRTPRPRPARRRSSTTRPAAT